MTKKSEKKGTTEQQEAKIGGEKAARKGPMQARGRVMDDAEVWTLIAQCVESAAESVEQAVMAADEAAKAAARMAEDWAKTEGGSAKAVGDADGDVKVSKPGTRTKKWARIGARVYKAAKARANAAKQGFRVSAAVEEAYVDTYTNPGLRGGTLFWQRVAAIEQAFAEAARTWAEAEKAWADAAKDAAAGATAIEASKKGGQADARLRGLLRQIRLRGKNAADAEANMWP
jgi:hypothetical protein